MADINLTAPRGDTIVLCGAVTKKINGVDTPYDISDPAIKIWFTAKRSVADADADAVFKYGTATAALTGVAITDGPGGLYTVTIPKADQGSLVGTESLFLVYDVQMEETGPIVTTLSKGRFVLKQDVTRTS